MIALEHVGLLEPSRRLFAFNISSLLPQIVAPLENPQDKITKYLKIFFGLVVK